MTDKPMSAHWRVAQDADALVLTVELWNGFGLSITAWKDDAVPPCVALRSTQHGEHDLAECNADAFRRWLDGAQGRGATR